MTIKPSRSYILLAAGKGTRMKSVLPKVLHSVCGQSLLERSLRAVAAVEPEEIIVVISADAEAVEAEIARISQLEAFEAVSIRTAVQEKQNGTGDAARVGLGACRANPDQVVILPGDIPLINEAALRALLDQEEAAVVSLLSCCPPDASGFGRVVRDESGALEAIVEQRDATEAQLAIQEINSSVYLVAKDFLEESLGQLESNNAQGELYLTDIVSLAVQQNVAVQAVCLERHENLAGANTRLELSQLEQFRRAQIVEEFQLEGVTFEDPQSTYIDEGVRIGTDAWIGANTRLYGKTHLGRGVHVEGDSLIRDSDIADRCYLKLGSYLSEAHIEPGCTIGPFVQLRPGAVLLKGAKLGNFVEVKNATLGAGAKANHLAYIGDASVGAESNIGAGVIFCNYDGVNKHHSKLGEKVFVGSNSVIVSPITVGDNAYVAAGSTITKDIPEDALAIARGKQSNIDGWVSRRRQKKSEKGSK